jgi:hypothetical protein
LYHTITTHYFPPPPTTIIIVHQIHQPLLLRLLPAVSVATNGIHCTQQWPLLLPIMCHFKCSFITTITVLYFPW